MSLHGLEVEPVSILSPFTEIFSRPGDSREKHLHNSDTMYYAMGPSGSG